MSFPPDGPRREPIFNMPSVVIALVAAMVVVHIARGLLSGGADWFVVSRLSFVPARLSLWLGTADAQQVLEAALGPGDWSAAARDIPYAVRLLLSGGGAVLWSPLTYGLLHGSVLHLVTNMLWLVAFGSPVARRIGTRRFILLLAAATFAGAIAHWLVDPLMILPLVGASAGISGATAAAARFVFAPGVRFGALGDDEAVRAIRAEPLGRLFANPRALAFVAVWFATNILFGSGLIALTGEDTSIAWQAHIGGFLAGLVLFPLLDRPKTA